MLFSVRLPSNQDRPMSGLYSAVSPYWLWALVTRPAAGMIAEVGESPSSRLIHEQLHPPGDFTAQFIIFAFMATPLAMVFQGRRGLKRLEKIRVIFRRGSPWLCACASGSQPDGCRSARKDPWRGAAAEHLDRLARLLHRHPAGSYLDGSGHTYHGHPVAGALAPGLWSRLPGACAPGRTA